MSYSRREISGACLLCTLASDRMLARPSFLSSSAKVADDVHFEALYTAAGRPELDMLALKKGILFGTSVQSNTRMNRLGPKGQRLYEFIEENFNLQVSGLYLFPDQIQPGQNVFRTANAAAQLRRAIASGKAMRGHCLIYPKRMSPIWFNSVITCDNWQSIIDAHLGGVAAIPDIDRIKDWDVLNEIIDGRADGGWRTDNPFFSKAGQQNGFIVYLYQKAAELFPGKDLYWCQDNSEQTFDGYAANLKSNVLAAITAAKNEGAPISGYNFQGHLTFANGFNSAALRSYLTTLTGTLGLKITVGELDVRTGVSRFRPLQKPATEYSAKAYDAEAYDLIRRILDVLLPFVQSTGGDLVCWSASDISHSWELDEHGHPSGERPSLWDARYQRKMQWTAVRNSLLRLQNRP